MVDLKDPEPNGGGAVVADCSYVLFVYPFLFAPETFDERSVVFSSAQIRSGRHELNVWNKDKFPGGDMLTSVANYLNPRDGEEATAQLWKMNWGLRDAFGLSDRAEWTLSARGKKIPFSFGHTSRAGAKETDGSFAFKLALFKVGVGFLTACVTPQTRSVDDWLDFAHFFRFINRKREVSIEVRASKTNRIYAAGEQFWPAPSAAEKSNEGTVFNSFIDSMLAAGNLPSDASRSESWWNEVFVPEQALPFAALFVDGQSNDADLPLAHKLQNFFHSTQTVIPAASDLDPGHASLLPYSDRQWFVFSLDGGAFLAADAPETTFFRETLPDHIRDHYFLMYLLTLHQRFFLTSLQQQITEKWVKVPPAERLASFESIRELLLEFTARSIFPQIMQREHHHRCYRKWQEVFQIEDLYREVRIEIRDMHEYTLFKLSERETRAARRIETLLAVLGLPALVIGLLGINIRGITSTDGLSLVSVLLLVAFVIVVAAAVVLTLRRFDRENE